MLSQALQDTPPFDEYQVLSDYISHLKRSLNVDVLIERAATTKDGPFPLQPKAGLTTSSEQ
jgi:hypothetical protein